MESPSNPGRVALPQKKNLAILSPHVREEESTRTPRLFTPILHYETVHIMEEYLFSHIEKGLAIYVSGQWISLEKVHPVLIARIRNDTTPSFHSLCQDVNLSYLWGWTCVMYIELTHGPTMINTSVRECPDTIMATLGEIDHSFEEKWKRWLPLLELSLK
jgi:hypothetical protein